MRGAQVFGPVIKESALMVARITPSDMCITLGLMTSVQGPYQVRVDLTVVSSAVVCEGAGLLARARSCTRPAAWW